MYTERNFFARGKKEAFKKLATWESWNWLKVHWLNAFVG